MQVLGRSFYERKTEVVARELLGKYLVCGNVKAKILETEAYVGPHDLASHSRFGKTKRNAVMFGEPGHAYVYLIYGLHFCLNIVTEYGAAVLIRATDQAGGPGRVCRHLGVDLRLNGTDVTALGPLYVANGAVVKKVLAMRRVGVPYAGDWKNKLLRFVSEDK